MSSRGTTGSSYGQPWRARAHDDGGCVRCSCTFPRDGVVQSIFKPPNLPNRGESVKTSLIQSVELHEYYKID